MLFMRGSLYIYMCTMIGTFIFLENLKKCLDKMVKWQPFASMPEQFAVIKEMIQEQTKAQRPILTQDAKEVLENKLLTSFLGEEEVLLTYYKDGYLYKDYITVVDINPINETIICTDAFHNQRMFKFGDVIEVN